jgi:integrase
MRGSKRERSPGVWELRAHLGQGKQVSRTFRGSERGADKALNALVSAVDAKQLNVSRATVADLLEEYVADRRPALSPATLAIYTKAQALIGDLGTIRLSRVTTRDVDRAYSQLRAAGASEHRLRQVHGLLKAAFRQGVRWRLVSDNPMLEVRSPRLPRTPVEVPDAEDVRALLEYLEPRDPDLADMLLLAATTGLRRGALCGLQWGDLGGIRITLRRSLVRVGTQIVERPPKMRQPGEVETLDLSEVEVAVLERIRARQSERRNSAGMGGTGVWVLSGDGVGGSPRKPENLNNTMIAACSALGIRQISPHDLRHFMATTALAMGAGPAAVASRLHHSSPAVTLRAYAHATSRGTAAIGDVVAAALSISEISS